MYGYVRPYKPNLTFRQFEEYQAAYCGLCHALAARFGGLARFSVSYDMTVAALLQKDAVFSAKTCPRRPFQRKMVASGPFLERVADASVILTWHKLQDQRRDGGILGARALSWPAGRAYAKAASFLPAFDAVCQTQLMRLHGLEDAGCDVPDEAADCFALLLAGLSALADNETERRVYAEFFYHIGRSIYLLDACDDATEDARRGRYNPLLCRYGALTGEVREEMAGTIELSCARAAAALALLPPFANLPILENIIYQGLPETAKTVLATKKPQKRRHAHEPV